MSPEKKKILIVDDEAAFTNLVKISLEETGGFEVRVLNLGAPAAEAAREFGPDLILLDMVMPDMEGSAVLQEIRSGETTRNIPDGS